MFRLIKDINALVVMANTIAAQSSDGPRWTLFLTNRSFLALALGVLSGVLLLFGIVIPGSPDQWIEIIAAIGVIGGPIWALLERIYGRTRVVWNRKQAEAAVVEADALTVALRKAGAPVG